MANIGPILMLGALIPLFPQMKNEKTASQIEDCVKTIQQDYCIKIHTEYNRDTFFSKKWQRTENPTGKQLSTDELVRSISVVKSFLSQHPKEVLKTHLTDIYLLSDFSLSNRNVAGSYEGKAIYLNNNGNRRSYSREFLLGTCHAEFSSLLFRTHSFPIKEWEGVNHFTFMYGSFQPNQSRSEDPYRQSSSLLTNGFLVPYSQNTLEDDFNDMSYWLFVNPKDLNQLCKNYPKIREKRDLAIKFYKSIDDKYVFDVKSAARGPAIQVTDPSIKKQQKAEAKQKAQSKQKQMKSDLKQKQPAQTNPTSKL